MKKTPRNTADVSKSNTIIQAENSPATSHSKKTMLNTFNYNGFAASVPGAGHIRFGIPCQDASAAILSPRPAAIVCDGRGSAKLSHFGARGAVKAFTSQISILEPFLAGILDTDSPEEKWQNLCRLLYRTLMQVKLDLAAERECDEKEFDFTVAFVIVGTKRIGCFQVGDGSIVMRQNGKCQTVFLPDKGEFANQTCFLRQGGEEAGKFQARLFPADVNSGFALTSDGPEHLMFHLPDMIPGEIFNEILDALSKGECCHQDLMDYLTRNIWNKDPRGNDDRSLIVMCSLNPPILSNVPINSSDEPNAETVISANPVKPAAWDASIAKCEPAENANRDDKTSATSKLADNTTNSSQKTEETVISDKVTVDNETDSNGETVADNLSEDDSQFATNNSSSSCHCGCGMTVKFLIGIAGVTLLAGNIILGMNNHSLRISNKQLTTILKDGQKQIVDPKQSISDASARFQNLQNDKANIDWQLDELKKNLEDTTRQLELAKKQNRDISEECSKLAKQLSDAKPVNLTPIVPKETTKTK